MERKLATILFADLVGSTELGASLDPEYARDLLDRFYDAMEAEIALGGGTVEKFIGDAVVAVFGAPAAQEDHAERALQVALWMQERLQELFGGRLALRIGVNSGEVVVGRPREGSSFATGDAVNVAARLEQAAAARPRRSSGSAPRPSSAARSSSASREPSRPRGRRAASAAGSSGGCARRGGRAAGTAWQPGSWVASASSSGSRTCRAHAGGRAPAARHGLWVRPAWARRASSASSGSGCRPGPPFRLGRCLSYGRGVTYSALADVLRQELGLRQEDSAEDVIERLAGREILGLTLGLDVAGDLEPRAALLRLQDAVGAADLASSARERPGGAWSSRICTGPRSRWSTCSSACSRTRRARSSCSPPCAPEQTGISGRRTC